MIHRIGTSGFQYKEWKGRFYPGDLPLARMLPYYADHFSSTEINYSFRRIPSASTLAKWDGLTPAHFVFSFKAPQKITHWAKLRGAGEETARFFDALSFLGPKQGAILFQLPPAFKKDTAVLLEFLATLPPKIRIAFEFRHASWFSDDVFAALAAHGAALCLAESADLQTPFHATAGFGYLRLRREDYSAADLKAWARKISAQRWNEAFVYFKHEDAAVGPKFAAAFARLFSSPE